MEFLLSYFIMEFVVFFKEKERKEWLIELDYRELKNRRRTLGNIRFIGELFKLKVRHKLNFVCIYFHQILLLCISDFIQVFSNKLFEKYLSQT